MKELIALLIFTLLSITTIYFSVRKQIDYKLTVAFFIFAIISGIVIANYDLINKFKWGPLEVQTAKTEITKAKEKALEEISSEVKDQKESIKLLISNANDTREKIEKQKEALSEMIKIATTLQNRIEDQKKKLVGLNEAAEKTKKDIQVLNDAASQIALILVRATYFSIETKSEFGTERVQKAIEEIVKDLNKVLPMVIPNERERGEWIKQLKNTLPSRQ